MLSHKNAYTSVLQFLGSDVGDGFDLTDEQGEELVTRLQHRVKVDVVLEPAAVLPHAEALFPPPDPDYVRRTTPQQQSDQEVSEVLNRYAASGHWEKVAIGYATPWGAGGKGIGSKANFVLLANAIKDFRSTGKTLRVDHVAEIVYTLASRSVFERPQTVVVEMPAPPPPPSARDLHNAQVARSRAMNDPSTSPLKGAKEAAKLLVDHKPVLTEEQRVALNEKKRADDTVIAEAQNRISNYASYTHSRTYSGRASLQAVFVEAMDAGKSAADVLRAVEAKIDQLTDNGSVR